MGQEKHEVMIIGGSGGLGASIARELAPVSSRMWLHGGHSKEKLDILTKELSRNCKNVQSFLLEYKNAEDFCANLPLDARPDVLIVAFGAFEEKSLEETSVKNWEYLVSANLALPGALLSKYAPQMAKKNRGTIVLFGGTETDTIRGYREIAAYGAAKTALGVLAKSAALEFGDYGVRTLVLCPGYVLTEYTTESQKKSWEKRLRGKTMQKPESWGRLILDVLLLNDNIMLNGSIISAGGWKKEYPTFDKENS